MDGYIDTDAGMVVSCPLLEEIKYNCKDDIWNATTLRAWTLKRTYYIKIDAELSSSSCIS